MKLRHKKTQELCSSSSYNINSCSEILVQGEDWYDTDFYSEYDVFLEATQDWKDMRQAFKDKDLIPNNMNTHFGEPKDAAERELGYSP
jgi:hypothetical protein